VQVTNMQKLRLLTIVPGDEIVSCLEEVFSISSLLLHDI